MYKSKFWAQPTCSKIKSPGEVLPTFIRASRDPKGEDQLWVAQWIFSCWTRFARSRTLRARNLRACRAHKLTKDIFKKRRKKSRVFPKKFLDTTFWTPKWLKHGCQFDQKWSIFGFNFKFLSSNIALLGPGKNLKSFPLIAKEIFKKRKKKSRFLPPNFWIQFFGPPKWPKHGCQFFQKWSIFGPIFDFWALILPCWVREKI